MTDNKSSAEDQKISNSPSKKVAKKKASPSVAATEQAVASIKLMLDEMKTERDSRDKQLTRLFEGLDSAFSRADAVSYERDEHSTQAIQQLTDSIMRDHDASLKELQERETLVDKKLSYLAELQEQQSNLSKRLAIPGVILGGIAVIYMFYVVTIMEGAMTTMSNEIQQISVSVDKMSGNMGTISQDTRALNANMGQMSRVMNHNVAPAMNGMRSAMPWGP